MADDDLADRLLAAIEETERTAYCADRRCKYPEEITRWCAADRKIVAAYQMAQDLAYVTQDTLEAGAAKVRVNAYDKVLRLLADGYSLTEPKM